MCASSRIFLPFSIILARISLVSMFLKHFSKLTIRVFRTQFQLMKSSLTHSILILWNANVEIFIHVELESHTLNLVFLI